MARIDFERAKQRRAVSDDVGDDLPRAGSWADMRRYLHEERVYVRTPAPAPRNPRPADPPTVLINIEQLRGFLAKTEQPAFRTAYGWQREQVLDTIARLRSRLLASGASRLCPELIARADRTLALFRNRAPHPDRTPARTRLTW